MFRLLRQLTSLGSSDARNVRGDTEVFDDRRRLKSLINVTVVFLDDTERCFEIDKGAKGQALLDAVFEHLQLIETDYFGLQYTANGLVPSAANADLLKWLDPMKNLRKQIRGGSFYFRVQFYVSDPEHLREACARHYFCLQLRKDILCGRLVVSPITACILAAYAVQYELGDYHPNEHKLGYLSGMVLIPDQTEIFENEISKFHKSLAGVSPAEADFNFLEHAVKLDMYGVDLHKAKDSFDRELDIGVTGDGVVVFQNNVRINIISWNKIEHVTLKKKNFVLELHNETSENHDTVLSFKMMTYNSSKHLWKSCMEHHTFFRFFKPRCTSRNRGFRRLLHGKLSNGSRCSYSETNNLPTIEDGMSQPLAHQTFISSARPSSSSSGIGLPAISIPMINCVNDGMCQSVHDIPADDTESSLGSNDNVVYNQFNALFNADERRLGFNLEDGSDTVFPVVSTIMPNTPAFYSQLCIGDQVSMLNGQRVNGMIIIDVLNIIQRTRNDGGRNWMTLLQNIYNDDDDDDDDEDDDDNRYDDDRHDDDRHDDDEDEDDEDDDDYDEDDDDEDDEDEEDAEDEEEDEEDAEDEDAEDEEEDEEEPLFQYTPESPSSSDPLTQSISALSYKLAIGSLSTQFKQVYKYKPNAPMDSAKIMRNVYKNRYSDIYPYDATRFILKDQGNDYINASYINMEVPGSRITNRYIATQGPLQTTIKDFWKMVLESRSCLIVMLTALVEGDRQKCAKYWPPVNESLEINSNITIKTVSEETESTSFIVYRQIELTDLSSDETRIITQIQYSLWKDHGVPENEDLLLSLVEAVRKERTGVVEPVIVHCSAGIGRTGVIILLETALCLIEAGQPVYPLGILKKMRDQRPNLVQNDEQFEFVCRCIYYAFKEGQVGKTMTGKAE